MDANNTVKAWKWLTITLAILNIALCVSIWFKPGESREHRHERPDEFIIGKLHFSDSQVNLFDELKRRHHDSVLVLQREGRKMRKELFDNLKNGGRTETQM